MKTRFAFALSLGVSFSLVGLTLLLNACDPIPRRTLSKEEKVADLYWIFSQFGENYAPLTYKETRYGIHFEKLKQSYLDRAEQTQTNEDFYNLMFQFVSEFKDAHTSASLTNAWLPERAQVSYLGFSGVRSGNSLLVKELLPTINPDTSHYPIHVGDFITELDGVALPDAIQNQLVQYRDLGQAQSNLTLHMNWLFTRVSTRNGQPSKPDALLTVKRGEVVSKITLPWVTKDLFVFQREQREAKPKKADEIDSPKDQDKLMVAGDSGEKLFEIGFLNFSGALELPSRVIQEISRSSSRYHFTDGFRFVDNFARWTAIPKKQSSLKDLQEQRQVPSNAVWLSDSITYPAYIHRVLMPDTKESQLVGTIYLNTFSPGGSSDEVVQEFQNTLLQMKDLGVKHLIIDLINNGGGSLELGLRLTQALSPGKVDMPQIQFRLSDTWFDEYELESLQGSSDTNRELSRRILTEMKQDQANGLRLSQPYSTEVLMPYILEPHVEIQEPFQVALLVNEMCASMCDIFTGVLQDNGMALVVGSQTMGAGGNVVAYQQAPNSHLDLRQTESLILRKDGSYIENNGVKPDIEVAVNESVAQKYKPVYQKAIEALLKE